MPIVNEAISQLTVMVTAVYDGLFEPSVGVHVTTTTQSLEAFTLPSVGAIASADEEAVIQLGKLAPPDKVTDVNEPPVEH